MTSDGKTLLYFYLFLCECSMLLVSSFHFNRKIVNQLECVVEGSGG
jgi:cell division protein FtsL